MVSFTGSAETAKIIRSHPAVAEKSVRCNIEADSLNSALLDPAAAEGDEAFNLLVSEVAREMTVKSGQKCTAIRRVFRTARALRCRPPKPSAAKLAKYPVGDPRNEVGAHGCAGEPRAVQQRDRRHRSNQNRGRGVV